jgi:ribosomal protein S27AE
MMFSDGDITGLNDDIAFSQLTGIRYDTNARGQIVIESKDDARSRGVKSPDRAESIMICFANSKMHGLIEFWAAQARAVKANAGAAQIGKKQAPSLAESQKKAAENDSPWIGAKVKTLQGKTGLNGLAKVVTTPQQNSCPNCGNPGLSRYGDSQWACRPCGFSGQGTEVVFNEKGERQ